MPFHGVPQGVANPPLFPRDDADVESLAGGRLGPAPGSIILIYIFLAAFVVDYFVNWKLRSFVWKIG